MALTPARHVRSTESCSHERLLWDLVSDRGTDPVGVSTSRTACSRSGAALPPRASWDASTARGINLVVSFPQSLFAQRSRAPAWRPGGAESCPGITEQTSICRDIRGYGQCFEKCDQRLLFPFNQFDVTIACGACIAAVCTNDFMQGAQIAAMAVGGCCGNAP